MRAALRSILLGVLAGACGHGPDEPDAAVSAMLAEARELVAEYQGDSLPPAGAQATALRRALREPLSARIELPRGIPWRHPLVDSATAEALGFLQEACDSGEVRLGEYEAEANPPRAVVLVRSGPGPGPMAVRLHLERRGGAWRVCEPFQRPRRLR